MKKNIHVIKGDITTLAVDAIVNAANRSLLVGGGVDGAIHAKAGRKLEEACRKLNGCAVGEAKMTPGFLLPVKAIIHTVAPQWYDCQKSEQEKEQLLKNCYVHAYRLAKENDLKTIAFPCLGAGIYQVPIEVSAKVAIDTALEYSDSFDQIFLVCFTEKDAQCYQAYFLHRNS